MSLGRTSMLAVAAIAALGSGAANAVSNAGATAANAIRHQLQRHSAIDTSDPETTFGYLRGPGWSAAHVKRMARKKRNKARHKAAVRR